MTHDFSTSLPKHRTRDDTLRLVRDRAPFFHNGRLLCDWLELTGKNDPTLKMLLAEGALSSEGRYVGLTRERSVIQHNRALAPFAEAERGGLTAWEHADLESAIADLDGHGRVGVLVADGYQSVANVNHLENVAPLFRFASDRAGKLGSFLLVMNFVLRGNRACSVKDGVEGYRRTISEWISREMRPDEFTVYRGGRISMMLCRVAFGF